MEIVDFTGRIIDALKQNRSVLDWIGYIDFFPNISSKRTPNAIFPAIIVRTVHNYDSEYADDQAFASRLRYQITAFSDSPINNEVNNAIDQSVKSLGFTRANFIPAFDENNNVYQNVFLYETEIAE